jgi:subtilisin family serine protease
VSSESGDHLDVAAPGKGLVSLAAGARGQLGHIGPVDDAGYAAAYVAATAALVRAYRPRLSASEVVARIERTAEDGSGDPRLGLGVVNPYAAVTAEGIDGRRAERNSAQDLIEPARPAPRSAQETAAIAVAVAGLLLAAILAVGVVAVKRGRARGWRPARR